MRVKRFICMYAYNVDVLIYSDVLMSCKSYKCDQ